MITVACVYRSGGDFTADDVARLAHAVERFVHAEHRFCCLTDRPDEVRPYAVPIQLQYTWPNWWAKMELFGLTGPVLYFDLDTRLIGPVDGLCEWVRRLTDSVVMLRGFYRSDACSGIMAWNTDLSSLLDQFAVLSADEDWKEQSHGVGWRDYQGDQEFVRSQFRAARIPICFAQTIQPGIYSYKVHVQPTGIIPIDARVICFHGKPRPFDVVLPEVVHG